jgi:chromosome segregation ATPase
MARTSAEADLDAVKSKKPDTSEADALRKDLQVLKDQHQAALMTSQQESAKATEEHLATKTTLEKVQAELEEQKAAADTQAKTSKADYQDLHDSLESIVQEWTKKASDLEARLKEAEAIIKVKDAEIAEAKVCDQFSNAVISLTNMIFQTKNTVLPAPKTPQGLAASKFAAESDSPETPSAKEEPESAEGENDSSSAALASVRQPSPNSQLLSLIASSPQASEPLTPLPEKRNKRTAALTDDIFSHTASES